MTTFSLVERRSIMASSRVGTPEYIKFLLSPDVPLDFHVNIGDPEKVIPERIGAVKWMLIARSRVLRVMLLESKLKETSGFNIKDIDPSTFKNFLTYLYGHDNTLSLPFEDSIKLLNAAEKYDVEDLKDALGKQIPNRVTSENVFTVLKYPAICEPITPVWETMTEIIQSQTNDLFANQKFLDLSLQAVLFILQQDYLNVTEIELWKAALRWAKHQGELRDSAGPEVLRELVLPMLKHIRLCTLSLEQFNFEVVISNVLTGEEISYICLSMKKDCDMDDLMPVNNTKEKRGHVSNIECYENPGEQVESRVLDTTFQITPVSCTSIDLCSIVCAGAANPRLRCKPRLPCQCPSKRQTNRQPVYPTTYRCQCTVEIKDVTDSLPLAGLRYFGVGRRFWSWVFRFDQQVSFGEDFEISMKSLDQRLLLRPGHEYEVKMKFDPATWYPGPLFRFDTGSTHDATENFEIEYGEARVVTKDNVRATAECFHTGSHMKAMRYRVLK